MGHIQISSTYHPIERHVPIRSEVKEKPERKRRKITGCSRLCTYYCSKHHLIAQSKQELQDHLRNSEDHTI